MAGRHAIVAGTGSVLPERVVPNEWFEELVDTSDEWIRQRTGIAKRHFAADGQATSDLAAEATRRALESAGVAAEQVDLLICSTLTPDNPIPAAAVRVQANLGISCPAFDLNAACAGFSYGLSTATAFLESGSAETIVVIGAEILSRVLDFTDRTTSVLFGDGAGAVVLRLSNDPGVLGSVLGADGTTAEMLIIPAGGSAHPATVETVAARDHAIRMSSGREVFKRAVVEMANACRELPESRESILATLELGIHLMRQGEFISDHEVKIGTRVAEVLCGGNITPGTPISEQYLLDLERENFKSLCGEKKTQERIQYTLKTGKTLRN